MAEVQTGQTLGELTQRFIEFVMMHGQNAALFLGQIPNPKTGEGEVNLELAKMFIDQLAMIQEKTRGNLTSEEATVLRNTLSNLQMLYVEVSQQVTKGGPPPQQATSSEPAAGTPKPEAPKPVTEPPAAAEPAGEDGGESKKKFTKSYGS